MANQTIKLYAQSFGYVTSGEPYQTHPVSGNNWYELEPIASGVTNAMYIQFEPMPAALKRKKLKSLSLTVQIQCRRLTDTQPAQGTLRIDTLTDRDVSFNPNTITYDNAPKWNNSFRILKAVNGGTTPVSQDYTFDLYSNQSFLVASRFFQRSGILVLDTDYTAQTKSMKVKTRLADGTTLPYVTVTYDDATDIDPDSAMGAWDSALNPAATLRTALYFLFGKELASTESASSTWNVSSAVFYWRVKGSSSSFNQIIASAADLESTFTNYIGAYTYPVPDYTFPAGSVIEWYVVITDTDGGTWQPTTVDPVTGDPYAANYAEFTTCDLTVTADRYPSGTINNSYSVPFSWSLRTVVDNVPVTQTSAIFHWKADGEANYHILNISGDTKSLSVPAYTFPAGKTITWYLSATGLGYTAFTAEKTFQTYSYTLAVLEYPQGNKVCSGDVLDFTYTLKILNTYDVQASVSKLYWREGTSGSYTAVTNSGTEKAVHVPAETFGTGMSVQWYLEVTAADGTTLTTSPKSFSTATSQITPQGSPTSGYTDPREDILFSWFFAAGSGSVSGTASLFWKVSTDENYTEEQASGNSITIQGGTFPTGSTINWYLAGQDYDGNASQTAVYSFSTAASTAYAVCARPVGRVEDGTKPIVFEWSVINADGTEPSRTLVEWKYDTEAATEWRELLDTTSAVYSYTAAVGTFSAGAIEWRVSAWNRDNVQGQENQASFVCMMAPDAPDGLRATSVPRTTVTWQSTGQEAFEIVIDGVVEAKEYGPGVYSWQREEPLEDGVHSIAVRIQGSYGMWSNYSETSIDIVNVPATTITLTGDFDIDAALSWAYGTTVLDPQPNVYRDGVRIAALADVLEFTDRYAAGEHEYFVTLWDADGYYTKSNVVTGTTDTRFNRIADADGGEWLDLRLTANSEAVENFQWTRDAVMLPVRGAAYPIAELGMHEEKNGSYVCAFRTAAEGRKLEALRSRKVILKSRKENVLVGVLTSLQKQVREFYITYSFSLQQVHFEDFIHDPGR